MSVVGDQMQIRKPVDCCNGDQVLAPGETESGPPPYLYGSPSSNSPTGHKPESSKLYVLPSQQAIDRESVKVSIRSRGSLDAVELARTGVAAWLLLALFGGRGLLPYNREASRVRHLGQGWLHSR